MTKNKYFPPEHRKEQFHCVLCGVFSSQRWFELKINLPQSWENTEFEGSYCIHCNGWTYWHIGKMILPSEAPVEPPHPDLPEDCVIDYTEARDIFARSPRAAAALLRLCIQKLLPHLGEKGNNINTDIGELVKKGLPSVIQQALDVCRVVGNNAVHPGEIDLSDSPETAQQLFHLINFIVEDRITRPKEIQALYNGLPEGSREAINKRDGNSDS